MAGIGRILQDPTEDVQNTPLGSCREFTEGTVGSITETKRAAETPKESHSTTRAEQKRERNADARTRLV